VTDILLFNQRRSVTVQQSERRWVTSLLSATQTRSVSIGLPVALLLILTSLVVGHLRRVEQEEMRADFEVQTSNAFNRLRAQFAVYLETVRSISSLYATGHELERVRFAAFVARTIQQYDGINGLGWNPRVMHSERQAYEQAARNDGLTDFQFRQWTPDGDTPWTASDAQWANEYVPAYLLEPHELNKSALGIDVASNPTRREALQRARDTGQAVATARITLAQDTAHQAGFLIFAPVYAVGASTETITDRRENLRGYAVGVFRVSSIVQQAMADLKFDGIALRISDQSADDDNQLLFDDTGNGQSAEPSAANAKPFIAESSSLSTTFEYEVGGRQWQIDFAATPEFIEAKQRWDSWLILATGISSSVLLGIVLRLVIGRATEVEKLVRQRTDQLHEANTQLTQEGREREIAQAELHLKAAELEKSNDHLTRFNKSASGRELRMIELKREINELLEASGKPARYDISFTEK
jgi:CHASE1-domain containing sensor protein